MKNVAVPGSQGLEARSRMGCRTQTAAAAELSQEVP